MKAELMGTKAKIELEDDAVPTIFTFTSKVEKRKLSEVRDKMSTKKQLVEDALCSTSQIENTNNNDNDTVLDNDTYIGDVD